MKPYDWISPALKRYALNANRPWRAQIFVPIQDVEYVNRQLNLRWGDEGDNLSVPMSSSGEYPCTHKVASGVLSQRMAVADREKFLRTGLQLAACCGSSRR